MTFTPNKTRFFNLIGYGWRHYLSLIKNHIICDDDRILLQIKTAYWAGAENYRAGLDSILREKTLSNDEQRALIRQIDQGLDEFAAQLNPLRRLDS